MFDRWAGLVLVAAWICLGPALADDRPDADRGEVVYLDRGCWACHTLAGAGDPREIRSQLATTHLSIERRRVDVEAGIASLRTRLSDRDIGRDEAIETHRLLSARRLERTGLLTHDRTISARLADLDRTRKDVGPNLALVRAKLRPAWLPAWLADPDAFRPTSPMPRYDLSTEEVEAISAFLWQAAPRARVVDRPPGDALLGKRLFESRGCVACHAHRPERVGSSPAVELTRIGEKMNRRFLVGWLLSPAEGGDTGIESHTWMPDLRLSEDEARHLATYLVGLGAAERPTEIPPFLEDPERYDLGRTLVHRHGCAGCHAIPGVEGPGMDGPDLTRLAGRDAEEVARWLDHEGAMPRFRLPDAERADLVAFLVARRDRPTPTEATLQAGRRALGRHGCVACHVLAPGQTAALHSVPRFAPRNREATPPPLVGVGARLDERWLLRFLADPSLGHADPDRNGVRPYLAIRMPSYRLDGEEIRAIVSYFAAVDHQPLPTLDAPRPPLVGQELQIARTLFTVGDCIRCHADDPTLPPERVLAPSYLASRARLRPDWTARWLADPWQFSPGVRMPTGLFVRRDDRWILAADLPDGLRDYPGDHIDLMVRYLAQIDPSEIEILKEMGR